MAERKRVIITGGNGFVGNELVRQLLGRHDLWVLDNLSKIAERIEDISEVPVHRVDITKPSEIEAAFEAIRPQIVIHLAAIHFIPECNSEPEKAMSVNLNGTQALLRLAEKIGVEHFVLTSSGAVYADSSEALTENSKIEPVDVYGWSKLFAENLGQWFGARGKMAVTAVRLFNTYGPRETNAHIIPEILSQLRKGDQLSLGNISPQRDYIFVNDTAEGFARLALRPDPQPYAVFNLCSGHHASVQGLIDRIAVLTDRKIEVIRDQSRFREADKEIQVGNNDLLFETLGWKPSTNLDEGLTNLLQFEGLL